MARDSQGGYSLQQLQGFQVPPEGWGDEASMLGSTLWSYMESVQGLTWLLVGDPAQLPPVPEDPSPALSVPGARLDTVVRQAAGNPITQVATQVREGCDFLGTMTVSEDLVGPSGGWR